MKIDSPRFNDTKRLAGSARLLVARNKHSGVRFDVIYCMFGKGALSRGDCMSDASTKPCCSPPAALCQGCGPRRAQVPSARGFLFADSHR